MKFSVTHLLKNSFGLAVLLYVLQQSVVADDFAKAVRSNDLSAINLLSETASDIDVLGTNGKTALMIAAKAGDFELVSKLIQLGANPNAINTNGGTPIMFASISGNVQIIDLLISKDADINARGSNGWGALMIASAKGHLPATGRLLNGGADINTFDIYRWSPLQRASSENHIEIVKALLQNTSLDIDHKDDHGATALHHAAKKGYTNLVRLLIAHGANPSASDSQGRTPGFYAQSSGHSVLAQDLEQTN